MISPTPAHPEPPAAEALLAILQGLAQELQPQRRSRLPGLDDSLERDLGLDSLGRVELLARLEKAFGVRLPEELIGSAETPRDLLQALAVAHPAGAAVGAAGAARVASLTPLSAMAAGEAAPDRTRTLLEVLEWHAERHPDRRHVLFEASDSETRR